MITFSNPRLDTTIEDYPTGLGKRGPCRFWFESKAKKGHRICRQTTGKVKTATFGDKGCIVDGSDGRTYILQFAGQFDFINVMRSDFMRAGDEVTGKIGGGIFPEDTRYEELKALILEAHK